MQDNNRPLITILIVIGIIIILLLAIPRLQNMRTYSYDGYALTASTVPLRNTLPQNNQASYTFVRYIPVRQVVPTRATYTTYSYYPSQGTYDNGVVFSDGCTLTSPYSTTTGQPCS